MIVSTYADPVGQYILDQAADGMIPGVMCTQPCKGCVSADYSTECTQCYTTPNSTYPYLFITRGKGTCLNSCTDGNFGDFDFTCKQCYSTCSTCSKYPDCSQMVRRHIRRRMV